MTEAQLLQYNVVVTETWCMHPGRGETKAVFWTLFAKPSNARFSMRLFPLHSDNKRRLQRLYLARHYFLFSLSLFFFTLFSFKFAAEAF